MSLWFGIIIINPRDCFVLRFPPIGLGVGEAFTATFLSGLHYIDRISFDLAMIQSEFRAEEQESREIYFGTSDILYDSFIRFNECTQTKTKYDVEWIFFLQISCFI